MAMLNNQRVHLFRCFTDTNTQTHTESHRHIHTCTHDMLLETDLPCRCCVLESPFALTPSLLEFWSADICSHSLNEAWPLFQRAVDPAMTGFDDLHAWFLSCMHNKSSQYIYIYAYPRAYIHTHIHTYIHPSSHTRIHSYGTYIHKASYIHAWMNACIHAHTYTHIIHTYMHAYMHACIHECMHACMDGWMLDECMQYVRTYVRTCVGAHIQHWHYFAWWLRKHLYKTKVIFKEWNCHFDGQAISGFHLGWSKTRVPATDGLV